MRRCSSFIDLYKDICRENKDSTGPINLSKASLDIARHLTGVAAMQSAWRGCRVRSAISPKTSLGPMNRVITFVLFWGCFGVC